MRCHTVLLIIPCQVTWKQGGRARRDKSGFESLPCGKDVRRSLQKSADYFKKKRERVTLVLSKSIESSCSLCEGLLEHFGWVNLGHKIG